MLLGEKYSKKKITDKQTCTFPPTLFLCSRRGLIAEDEYQNIFYPKAAMRDYNISLQNFPQIPVS